MSIFRNIITVTIKKKPIFHADIVQYTISKCVTEMLILSQAICRIKPLPEITAKSSRPIFLRIFFYIANRLSLLIPNNGVWYFFDHVNISHSFTILKRASDRLSDLSKPFMYILFSDILIWEPLYHVHSNDILKKRSSMIWSGKDVQFSFESKTKYILRRANIRNWFRRDPIQTLYITTLM